MAAWLVQSLLYPKLVENQACPLSVLLLTLKQALAGAFCTQGQWGTHTSVQILGNQPVTTGTEAQGSDKWSKTASGRKCFLSVPQSILALTS